MKLNRFHKIVLVALVAAQHFLAVAETTNTLAPSGYAKFITDRNIFDPDRVPNVPYHRSPPRPPSVVRTEPHQPDSFSLVGIIGYDEGRMAGVHVFFDGSSSLYQKEAELNGSIANFKVAGISPDSVTLVAGTNTMVLEIGEQLHDDASGHWFLANGTSVRYNDTGGNRFNNRYGNDNGRNSDRGGFGGRRRGNNGGYGNDNGGYNNGNNGYGNYNNGNGRNFNRGRNNNNYDSSGATSDDSQAQDENATPSGGIGLPVLTPDGIGKMTPDGIVTPDGTLIPVQNNTMAPDNSDDPNDTTPQDNN